MEDAFPGGFLRFGVDEESALGVEKVGYGPDLRGDDRQPHGLSFYDADAEALPFRGRDENVGDRKEGGHVEGVDPAQEADSVRDVQEVG